MLIFGSWARYYFVSIVLLLYLFNLTDKDNEDLPDRTLILTMSQFLPIYLVNGQRLFQHMDNTFRLYK